MSILNKIDSKIKAFQRPIIFLTVFVVVLVSVSWLIHMDRVLTENSEWCLNQAEAYPLNVCGGIAERDIERTYYLKVLMFSVLVFGPVGLILYSSQKRKED